MKAALYLRVSTRDGRQDTDNQRAQLRHLCESEGWKIDTEFEDHETGGKPERRQFQAMMTAAAEKRFDVLVFWALDRLSREGALETLQYLKRAERLWCRLPVAYRAVLGFLRKRLKTPSFRFWPLSRSKNGFGYPSGSGPVSTA